jgi:flavin reductase (DIM6/NTAB) family NADH-FMN oxidoreductase RutF
MDYNNSSVFRPMIEPSIIDESVIDESTYINVMRYAGAAVTVVTTGAGKARSGATVSAMCSLAAKPAAVLVCIYNDSRTAKAIKTNGCFCVNVLSEVQVDVAKIFAGMQAPVCGDRFGEHTWKVQTTGSPILQGAVATFDCFLERQILYATHTIFIGTVVHAEYVDARPLFYCNRQFVSSSPLIAS